MLSEWCRLVTLQIREMNGNEKPTCPMSRGGGLGPSKENLQCFQNNKVGKTVKGFLFPLKYREKDVQLVLGISHCFFKVDMFNFKVAL